MATESVSLVSRGESVSTVTVKGVSNAFAHWKSELLDLTKANRLLYFRPRSGALEVVLPEVESLFEGLVNRGSAYEVYQPDEEEEEEPEESEATQQLSLLLDVDLANGAPNADANGAVGGAPNRAPSGSNGAPDEAIEEEARAPSLRPNEVLFAGEAKKVQATLYRLRLRSRSALQEQGINVLYVAFGFLEWVEAAASNVRILSPLILVPVNLDRETALDPFTLEPLGEDPILNPALVFKLKRDFDLDLSLPETDDGDPDLGDWLDYVREKVKGRRDWNVRDVAHLGVFSFAKHAMYADLEANQERFNSHPFVRALAREEDGLPEPISGLPSAEQLDEQVKASDIFQVLDADASQQEAIEAVKAGASLVIQGPPGTGKSQTIANIIAECLAQGKKVLFVSEKMAALRVVAKRLKDTGLHEFCLEAHSQDVNKKTVIQELAATLQAGRTMRGSGADLDLQRIDLLKRDLNAYVRALWDANNPLGLLAFRVHGELARLQHVPVVMFPLSDVGGLTRGRLVALEDVVRQLVRVGDALLAADTHPWRGCVLTMYSPQVQIELESRLRQLATAAEQVATAQAALRSKWGVPADGSLRSAEWLRDLLALLDERLTAPGHWFTTESLVPLMAMAHEYRRLMEDYKRRLAALLQNYSLSVFQNDFSSVLRDLEAAGAPHAGFVRGSGDPADRAVAQQDAIGAAVERAVGAMRDAEAAAQNVASRLGLPLPTTLNQARSIQTVATLVLKDPRPQRDWFGAGRRAVLEELAAEAGKQQQILTEAEQALRTAFEEEFFELATVEFADRFEQSYRAWWRAFKPSYHRDLGLLRRQKKDEGQLSYDEALEALRQNRRRMRAQHWLDEHRQELSTALGDHYAGSRTDWRAVTEALAIVKEMAAHVGEHAPARLLEVLSGGRGELEALRPYCVALDNAMTQVDDALAELNRVLVTEAVVIDGLGPSDAPIGAYIAWLANWVEGLTPLRTAAETMNQCRRSRITSVRTLATEAREALALQAIEAGLAAASETLRRQFGHLYEGVETRWDVVVETLGWAGRILQHFGGPPPESFVQCLETLDRPERAAERHVLVREITALGEAIEELRPTFSPDTYLIGGATPAEAWLSDVVAWAQAKRQALPQLMEWIDLNQALARAEVAELGEFAEGVARERLSPVTWHDAFLRQIYTLWLTWRYEQAPELARFRGQHHNEKIQEFQCLDRQQWRAASRRIAERLVQKRPVVGLNMHPKSEPATLLKEASKQKRFRPLRKLFAQLPTLLPALKPCLLMSPLSVAQFLGESAMTFDVVVFDEASQILPADAIGAIGRGKQVVVVGDQRQLPPTRFFAAAAPLSDDDDDEEPPESILGACMAAGLPQKPLLWHYRSRHEHLIAFSNRFIYDRRLITFPSPNDEERAVEYVYVEDGVYDRASSRVNRAEARRIADLVVEHVGQRADQSLDVITFSEAQMVAIQTELDVRKRVRPELEELLREDGPEGFFVKNLENVQGDERDVIFFSVGYGPDHAGNMTINFGPLNKQGGERRLNVAVTRARDRVKILASFHPHDIDRTRTQAEGVHLLRSYLEFADQGPRALLGEITREGGEPDSPFEAQVADALMARGLKVVSQVGVGSFKIDLGIKDEASDRYVLGVECDGAAYHSSKTARDRDRLREEVLRRLEWEIHRIWSTDWVMNPSLEVEKVVHAYERARKKLAERDEQQRAHGQAVRMPRDGLTGEERDGEGGAPEPSHDSIRQPWQPVDTDEAATPIRISAPYEMVTLPRQGTLEDFQFAPTGKLATLVVRCVQSEGPVHEDRVLRSVAESYGIARVGSQIRKKLRLAIEHASRHREVERRGKFLWSRNMGMPPVRAASNATRPINWVAPEEIGAAMIAYLETAFAMQRDDLISAIARELGYDRTGGVVAAAIGEVVDRLVEMGALEDVGGQVSLKQGHVLK